LHEVYADARLRGRRTPDAGAGAGVDADDDGDAVADAVAD